MEIDIKNITKNYKERIERITLFDPLYKLENKKTKDNSGKYIDFFSLGLLTLLFFFENMLMRNKKTGINELASFLYRLNKDEINLDYSGFQKTARTIIDVFRPPSGKRNFRKFYNWETRKEEIIQYSILKASKSDTKSNTQYYTLDEKGLELIFATKEYFSEFQLSINQLLLRKQLEKGEFSIALRQIDEMRIDVKTLEDRINKLKHEIQRNIMAEKTYERYKELIGDINRRLTRENEEFNEIKTFIKETKKRLGYELKLKKDQEALTYIIKIDNKLSDVHTIHNKLLQRSIELKTTTIEAAQESLYYIGIEAFNFKKEIVSRLFSSPLPVYSTRNLIKPFLYLEKQVSWSPMSVFSQQRLENKDNLDKSYEFLDLKSEEQKQKEIKIIQDNFKYIFDIILKVIYENETTLKDIIEHVKENEKELLNKRVFYDFFMLLHQKSPIYFDDEKEEVLFKKVIENFKEEYREIKLIEENNTLNINDRFSIKDMRLSLEVKGNEL
ncbi:MAG: replicative DNA helicase [Firmicutes bacterium]|nr:replicative DNA helicase [Bacillota bacterium]